MKAGTSDGRHTERLVESEIGRHKEGTRKAEEGTSKLGPSFRLGKHLRWTSRENPDASSDGLAIIFHEP